MAELQLSQCHSASAVCELVRVSLSGSPLIIGAVHIPVSNQGTVATVQSFVLVHVELARCLQSTTFLFSGNDQIRLIHVIIATYSATLHACFANLDLFAQSNSVV